MEIYITTTGWPRRWRCTGHFPPSSHELFLDMPLLRVCNSQSLCAHSFHTGQGGCHSDLIKSIGMLHFSFSSSCYAFVRDIVLHDWHLHAQCLGFHAQGVTYNSVSVYSGCSPWSAQLCSSYWIDHHFLTLMQSAPDHLTAFIGRIWLSSAKHTDSTLSVALKIWDSDGPDFSSECRAS